MKSNDLELTSTNPFKYGIGQRVMGYDYNRGRHFICGTIAEIDHRGHNRAENAYRIESEYGGKYSGTLFENGILPFFDRDILSKELIKDNMLTVKILSDFGTSVVVERDGKELFSHRIDDEKGEGNDADPGNLLKSYEKLLTCLNFKPLSDDMYLGDGLLILKFAEPEDEKNTDRISNSVLGDIRSGIGGNVQAKRRDDIINSLSSNELFERWCEWNGFIGLDEKIKRAVFEIYGIKKL